MAKTSFTPEGEKPVDTPAEKTEIAAAAPTALTTHTVAGALGTEDLPYGRITVYHPMSQYEVPGVNAGDLVLDKEHILGTSVKVIVLAALRRWKEKIDFDDDDGEDARIASTPEQRDELIAELGPRNVIPFCDLIFLVEQPEGAPDDAFQYELGGKAYALAKFTTQKKNNVAETYGRVKTARVQHDLEKCVFELSTKPRQWEKYKWHAPVLTLLKGVEAPEGAHALIAELVSDD